jgi:hypothetical protein
MKRAVEPFPEIPISQQVHPHHCRQIREAPIVSGSHHQIFQQQHGDQRDPDLRLNGVLAGSHKRSNAQDLLECLEEQFDLPTVFIDFTDGRSRPHQVIGQQNNSTFLLFIPDNDPAQSKRTFFFCLFARQFNHLILSDIGSLRRGSPLAYMVNGIILETSHKLHAPRRPSTEHPAIIVGSIHYHHSFRLKNQRFGHRGFMDFAIGDQRPAGKVFPAVQL